MRGMKRYIISLLLLAPLFFTACEHDNIYKPIDFNVLLSESNTYQVGEPVTFNFEGNADYIVFYSGEVGHEYQYRNRTFVDAENILGCEFTIQLNGRSGTRCMTAYVTNTFEGLNGEDEAADKALIESLIDENGDLRGWEKIELNDPEKNTVWETTQLDVSKYADNFCVALHWNPQSIETTQRNYWVNANVEVEFEGYDPQVIYSPRLNFIPFSMNDEKEGERYILTKENGVNGTMRYTGNTGLNTTEFVLTGSKAYSPDDEKTLPYAIDAWVISTPTALNLIDPDKGVSIKTITEPLNPYTYTFDKPGTYTVTFVATSGNYEGQSSDIKEFTVTIVEPLK